MLVKTVLDFYLKKTCEIMVLNFDVLKWLADSNFPILYHIVRDVLVILVSIVTSKLTFSTCGCFMTPYHSAQDLLWKDHNGMKVLFVSKKNDMY